MFFSIIVSGVMNNSETKLSASMISSFDAIFSGSKASDDTVSIVPAPPKTEIEFICDSSGYSEIAVAETAASRQNANRVLFAHRFIQGRQFIIFTEGIDIPFKVDNALYITDFGVKYFIVEDADRPAYAEILYDLMPDNVTKEVIRDISRAELDGYREIVVVAFSPLPSGSENKLARYDSTLIYIQSNNLRRQGRVQFKKRVRENEQYRMQASSSHHYFGDALLLGAVFSEDADYYECGVAKMLTKSAVMAQLYHERTKRLKQKNSGGLCQAAYSDAMAQFEKVGSMSGGSEALRTLVLPTFDTGPAKKLYDANKNLQLHSCPQIY